VFAKASEQGFIFASLSSRVDVITLNREKSIVCSTNEETADCTASLSPLLPSSGLEQCSFVKKNIFLVPGQE
jgi:hypothetical protein